MYDEPLPLTVTWSARDPRAACTSSITGAAPVTCQSDGSRVPASKSSQSCTCAAAQRLAPKKVVRSVGNDGVDGAAFEWQPTATRQQPVTHSTKPGEVMLLSISS